jgi:hypothetical protein
MLGRTFQQQGVVVTVLAASKVGGNSAKGQQTPGQCSKVLPASLLATPKQQPPISKPSCATGTLPGCAHSCANGCVGAS